MEKKIERRYFGSSVEIRAGEDGKVKGGKGLAAVYNKLSDNLGGFREKIAPGAFDGVLDNDVRVLRDHKPGQILGRTSKGTAKISLTSEGLEYTWDDPDTTYSRDLQKSMARGDIDQSSFGFTVDEDDWEEDEEGRMIRTIKKVRELFDVSPVTFPAYPDATVAKRSLDKYMEGKQPPEKETITNNSTTNKKVNKMDRIKQLEDKRAALVEANEEILSELETGQGEIRSFTDDEKERFDANKSEIERLDHQIDAYRSTESSKAGVVKDTRTEQQKAAARAAASGTKSTPPEEREAAQFSFTKLLKEVRDKTLSGFEKEMAQEGAKSFRESGAEAHSTGGILIPNSVLTARKEKRAIMTSGTVASPGEAGKAVNEEIRSFIDHLYANLALVQAGADFQTGLVGNIKWPRENAVASGTWEGETDDNAESTPTNTNVSMAPLRCGTYVDVSNQALIQTSPSVGARIERQMVTAIAQAIDIAGIEGAAATPPTPEGILSTTGIGSVPLGTNGDAITWEAIVNLEREVDIDNALMGNLSYLTNAKVRAELKTVKKDAGSGIFLLDSLMGEGDRSLNGYNIVFSNNVPSDLTKAMGSALSASIFGNFNDLIIGQWGGIEVLVDPYTQGIKATTRYIINSFNDVAVLRPQSFAAITDIVTA